MDRARGGSRNLSQARRDAPDARRRAREAATALRELPSSRLLEQNLARQVARLGMSTVSLVLDPTPMKAVRAALRAFELAQEMTRDEGRGR